MQRIQLVQSAESKIGGLSRVLGIIAIGILVGMMLVTVIDVLLRGVFHSSFPGSLDLTEVGMVLVGFLGLSWWALENNVLFAHISLSVY